MHSPCVRLFHPATRGRATVFVLHRFGDPHPGSYATSLPLVREVLAYLRRNRYHLVSIEEVVRSFAGEAPPLHKAVAFTIDDGYEDQASLGAGAFLEFDCPLTIFLTTGFLDGLVLPWWDGVNHVFNRTPHRDLRLSLSASELDYSLASYGERRAAEHDFLGRCKEIADADRREAIGQLAGVAEVPVPDRPFPPYMPMSWDQARSLERSGVTFGPHTVSHPILSRISAEAAEREIVDSWRRLNEELSRPVPVFCYPNGGSVDFGSREVGIMRRLGLVGALTVDGWYAQPRLGPSDATASFKAGRFPLPEDPARVLLCASGADQVRRAVRVRLGRGTPAP